MPFSTFSNIPHFTSRFLLAMGPVLLVPPSPFLLPIVMAGAPCAPRGSHAVPAGSASLSTSPASQSDRSPPQSQAGGSHVPGREQGPVSRNGSTCGSSLRRRFGRAGGRVGRKKLTPRILGTDDIENRYSSCPDTRDTQSSERFRRTF